MQGLGGSGGFIAQEMSGHKADNSAIKYPPVALKLSSGPIIIDTSGLFFVVFQCSALGPQVAGADENGPFYNDGGGGGLIIKHKRMRAGDTVNFTDDVLTFPDGTIMGQVFVGVGIAPAPFGGEINLRGTNGPGGASASYLPVFPSSGSGGGASWSGSANIPFGGGGKLVTIIKSGN